MDKEEWYVCIMEYYLTIKKSEILPFAAKWMDLEGKWLPVWRGKGKGAIGVGELEVQTISY